MTDINLTIDDTKLSVPAGTNIFMAAKNNGIYISGLCYHPNLSQYGGCRLCMVEVTERGRSRHKFSCAQPCGEGMVVKTKTPDITRYTKSVMEYMLAHHPLDCPTCDKSGECGLQDITHDLKLSPGRFKSVRWNEPMKRDNPLLELNVNRCILCGRCVKVCKEVEGQGAIDFQNRGMSSVVGTAFDKPLDCTFCGGCVSVCPTGSWQDRTLKFRARPWELTKTTSICTYCAVGCTVVLNTKKDKVLRTTSDDDLGINEGNLCVKGRFGHEFINSNRRIKTPLVKKSGILCPTTWEDALDQVAKGFQKIIDENGGNAIGALGSEKCTNEDNYVFQKFCRAVLGTGNIDNMANIKSPSLNGLIDKAFQSGITTTSTKEMGNADTIFFVGADVGEAHPVIGTLARKAIKFNKANLIIANTRNVLYNSTAKNDVRLNYKLGTLTTLINAMTKAVVDGKLVDIKKAESATVDLKGLRSMLKSFDMHKAYKSTSISEDDIKNASALLAKPGNCYIVCGRDVIEGPVGNDAVNALTNLTALLNAANSSGKTSIIFARTNNNSQGVNDMGVVPRASDAEAGNIFDLALKNKLKALYVMGENPIVSCLNGKEVRDAFKKLDFLVVQDTFLTETAQLADVVLPSATYAEKGGTFTSMGLEVQRLNKAISPVGEARPDWSIISDLAVKMGHAYSYASEKDIFKEIGDIVSAYSGIDYDGLGKDSFNRSSSNKKPSKYEFEIDGPTHSAIKKSKDYPFILMTGSSLSHQGSFSRNSSSLVDVAPDCCAEINRKDAQDIGVTDGGEVAITSGQDKMKFKVKVTNKSPKGIVFVSEDHEWVPVNKLRDDVYTHVKISKA